MINEPTYWSAECDLWGCKHEWQPYDYDGHEDEESIVALMREDGWIVLDVVYQVFCSLDHLLTYRAHPHDGESRRAHMSKMAEIHASRHRGGRWCCHGFHAVNHPNGLGHDYDCPGYTEACRALRAAKIAAATGGGDSQ